MASPLPNTANKTSLSPVRPDKLLTKKDVPQSKIGIRPFYELTPDRQKDCWGCRRSGNILFAVLIKGDQNGCGRNDQANCEVPEV